MILLRSLLFQIAFYVHLIAMMLACMGFLALPRRWGMRALKLWARNSCRLLRVCTGLRTEIRGLENIPGGPLIVAAKHQSMWETFALLPLLDDPAVVLKSELTKLPLFGWFALRFGMIPIDRDRGARAMRKLFEASRKAMEDRRQIVIFPEGTRRLPGARPDYKPGLSGLYRALGVPCVPVALNSGVFWPRRSVYRYPGVITMEFLEPITPGLSRKAFEGLVESRIEEATARLVEEARRTRA